MISASETFSCPIDLFAGSDIFKSFDGDLIMIGQLKKELQIFLKSVAHFLGVGRKWVPSRQNLLQKVIVGHIGSLFDSGFFGLQIGLLGDVDNLHQIGDDLGQGTGQLGHVCSLN